MATSSPWAECMGASVTFFLYPGPKSKMWLHVIEHNIWLFPCSSIAVPERPTPVSWRSLSLCIFRHALSMLKEGESCLGKGAASLPNVFWKTDLSSRGRRRKAAVGNDPSREGGISLAACGVWRGGRLVPLGSWLFAGTRWLLMGHRATRFLLWERR